MPVGMGCMVWLLISGISRRLIYWHVIASYGGWRKVSTLPRRILRSDRCPYCPFLYRLSLICHLGHRLAGLKMTLSPRVIRDALVHQKCSIVCDEESGKQFALPSAPRRRRKSFTRRWESRSEPDHRNWGWMRGFWKPEDWGVVPILQGGSPWYRGQEVCNLIWKGIWHEMYSEESAQQNLLDSVKLFVTVHWNIHKILVVLFWVNTATLIGNTQIPLNSLLFVEPP